MSAWQWALLGLFAGALAGSFVATLVLRWPAGGSIADGRSRCDGCRATLGPLELVPILGYLLLRGRCRRCGAAIDPRHLVIELAAAAIGAASLVIAPGTDGMAGALLGWLLLALGALDAEHLWLPNALTLWLLATGIAAGALRVEPVLLDRAIGALAGYAALASISWLYARLRHRQGLGGGDAKLFAGIGAWLGWAMLPMVLLLAALAGLGIVALRLVRRIAVSRYDRLPLGTLLAGAAWLLWAAERLIR